MDLSEYRGAYKKAERPANDSERRVEQRRSSPGQQRKDREGHSKETRAKEAWKHVTASSSKRRSKAAAPAPKRREYEPTYESEYVARKGGARDGLRGSASMVAGSVEHFSLRAASQDRRLLSQLGRHMAVLRRVVRSPLASPCHTSCHSPLLCMCAQMVSRVLCTEILMPCSATPTSRGNVSSSSGCS